MSFILTFCQERRRESGVCSVAENKIIRPYVYLAGLRCILQLDCTNTQLLVKLFEQIESLKNANDLYPED